MRFIAPLSTLSDSSGVEGYGMPCRGLMVGVEDRRAAPAPAPAQLRQLVPAATAGLSAWR